MIKLLLWIIVTVLCWPIGLLVGLTWLGYILFKTLVRGTAAVTKSGVKVGTTLVTPQYKNQHHDWEIADLPRWKERS